MALTTQFIKLYFGKDKTTANGFGCIFIKDFPDIDPKANLDQVEITTLNDVFHKYADGAGNFNEPLEFTANYSEAEFNRYNIKEFSEASAYAQRDFVRHNGIVYQALNNVSAGAWNDSDWGVAHCWLCITQSNSSNSGTKGQFYIEKFDLSIRLVGAGTGDALNEVFVVEPKSAITFEIPSSGNPTPN